MGLGGVWPRPPSLCFIPTHPGRAAGGANTELLPRLRLLAAQSHQRIEAWPRLQALVNQW